MTFRLVALSAAIALTLAITGDAQVCVTHIYLGNNPDEGNPGWHEEAQGLAHDRDYWYATQNPPFTVNFQIPAISGGGPRLWRIPVTHDLGGGVSCGQGSVSCKPLFNTPLMSHGYAHYGDPDFYEFNGRGYILVPIEKGDQGPGVAIFRADATLSYLAFTALPGQKNSGWVAVDPGGFLLSSEGDSVTEIHRYWLDWVAFQESGEREITLVPEAPLLIEDEAGAPLELVKAQGGEYSDDGRRFYFSGGYGGGDESGWGVHVFDVSGPSGAPCGPALNPCTVARRVERSHNGPGGFAFEFNTSNDEEPEGLTYWDLDADGRAPGLRGQLHVVLLDNDHLTADDVYVKHYRLSSGDVVPPTISCPENTVVECTGRSSVAVSDAHLEGFLAGARAVDQCDANATAAYAGPRVLALGRTSVTFTATDSALNSSSCRARVTVVDTLPPQLVCPEPAVLECSGPRGVDSADPQLESFLAGIRATDVCDASPRLSRMERRSLPLGTTPLAFSARDGSGNAASCETAVRVADTAGPRIRVRLSASTIGPANGRLVPVTAFVHVEDRCDPSPSFALVSITSNESGGDGPADIQGAHPGTADTTFALRAERSAQGQGRVYTIVYRATDAAGNSSTATAHVRVPVHWSERPRYGGVPDHDHRD